MFNTRASFHLGGGGATAPVYDSNGDSVQVLKEFDDSFRIYGSVLAHLGQPCGASSAIPSLGGLDPTKQLSSD